jgi:hypothetical protein
LFENETVNLELMQEIKRYEEVAEQRKRALNMEYIVRKIQMQRSARMIQRAWRKYRTHKIINWYSKLGESKASCEAKADYCSNPKILNLKSRGL